MKKTETKDLNYYKNNCEEDYIKTPISVLRYISELEAAINYTRCCESDSVLLSCEHEWVKPIINAENIRCLKCGVWEELIKTKDLVDEINKQLTNKQSTNK